jgi:Flp pilus assembly protein TadG
MSLTATEADMKDAAGTGILRSIRRFARETHGISAVEFALLLPLMLTLYLGGTEITQGITIKRKTIIATRAIGDLVSQATNITDAQMQTIFDATTAVLALYSSGNFKVIVSSVGIDGSGNAKIIWSEATGGATAHAANDPVTLPTGLNAFPNTSLIWAEGEYDYTPAIGYVITGQLTLKDHLYLRPRLKGFVCRETGGQTTCS